ncbi:hypothetical protein NXH76_27640 [Blautia schinkii]|nr:hypothetical protein [Blautia schinkii]
MNEEMKTTEVYRWTKLFTATEWEEVLQMAKESEAMQEAVVTLRSLTDDEKIKMQCKARKRYEADRKAIYMSGIEEGKKEGIEEGKKEGFNEGIQKGAEALILDNLEEGKTEQQIITKLMQRFALNHKTAEEYVKKYMVP